MNPTLFAAARPLVLALRWRLLVVVSLITVASARGADAVPAASPESLKAFPGDWLVTPPPTKAGVFTSADGHELIMTNGLIQRTWRIAPNVASIGFRNLSNQTELLRGVKPEALIEVDGVEYDVGGLSGQPNYAYLTKAWTEALTADPAAMKMTHYEVGPTRERFAWKRVRHNDASLPWPPPGASLRFDFEPGDAPPAAGKPALPKGLVVSVHYEMFDGIPVISKWITLRNGSEKAVRLTGFVGELLAVVEGESVVDKREEWRPPNLHVETDYTFAGMDPQTANACVRWVADPQYATQVNYELKTPCMLRVRPALGPDAIIPPGETFATFRTYELPHDNSDRERQGLAIRRMYRTIAPWVTENPIMMHLTSSKPSTIRQAVDQVADVGFEMIILSFGSGLDMESTDPKYIDKIKESAAYAHSKGIDFGGYSLLASRQVSAEDDVINPKTGKTGGAVFGNSPCLVSKWGLQYFHNIQGFIQAADLTILEHDGSYPGDVCASEKHPGHHGLADSQWTQWRQITNFYHWCRAQGVYLNVPDWYFLNGSNKTAMGYRETNWSLPRAQQIIHARQNMFDGTWEKAPSMGWMFVPLVQYQGGGDAATIEPLDQHLDAYEAHLANCFGFGVQACYRGPRLYDTDRTRTVVKKWVDWFKAHRAILESDVIHLRRADGRDWDGVLHVNSSLKERGLAMIYNPLETAITRDVNLPLYYTGVTASAKVRIGDTAEWAAVPLARDYSATVKVTIPAGGNIAIYIRNAE